MSKSELKSLGPSILITRRIGALLKRDLEQLKEILSDNLEFANSLIERLLLAGKGVYTNDINRLIYEEYNKHNKNDSYMRTQLFDLTYKLGTLIAGNNELIRNEKTKHPELGSALRNEIEAEVRHIFFHEENANVDIMGESDSQ